MSYTLLPVAKYLVLGGSMAAALVGGVSFATPGASTRPIEKEGPRQAQHQMTDLTSILTRARIYSYPKLLLEA